MMRDFCRNNKEKVISGMLSGSLLTGDMIITIIANTGLSEPVFPDAAASGHVFIFPAVVFAISGFLGVILSIYRDTMKWLLNIHAAFLGLTILISTTSFMAISNNVKTFDVSNCLSNGTMCDCRDGTEINMDCDTLLRVHVNIFIVIITYLSCILLCLVETVWDVKRMCCSDEIEDIPGILHNSDNTAKNEKTLGQLFTVSDNAIEQHTKDKTARDIDNTTTEDSVI